MTKLTEHTVLARTRAQDLRSVRKLNAWGSELTDVSIVKYLPNVEVLSLSVNSIATLQDFAHCNNLQELYLRKNSIVDLSEIRYLQDLPKLRNLWLADNPCANVENYRLTVIHALPQLQKLDNITIHPEEQEAAKLHKSPLDDDQVLEHSSEPSESYASEIPIHNESAFSSDLRASFSLEVSSSSKTSTPQPSPVDSFLPKLEENASFPRPFVEEAVSSNHHKENEKTPETLMQQHLNVNTDIQSHYSTGKGPNITSDETKPNFDLDLLKDKHVDLTNDKLLPAASAVSNSGRFHSRNERPTAFKMLPKGGKNRNANILSAVLCLIKELDWPSLEVVDTAVHCLMEELEANEHNSV